MIVFYKQKQRSRTKLAVIFLKAGAFGRQPLRRQTEVKISTLAMARNIHENSTDHFDHSVEPSHSEFDKYLVFSKVIFIVEVALTLFGVTANCIICVVLRRKKRLRKNFSNFHLFNLALTDIFFRLAATPILLTIENTEVEHGNNAICKFAAFVSCTTLAATFLLLLGISVDRYVHIVHPLKARSITWKHSRVAIILSWLYAAACSSPLLFSVQYTMIEGNVTANGGHEVCLFIPGLPFQVSSAVFLVVGFLVPLVLMSASYAAILRALWMRARSKLINAQIVAAKFRAVKMMILVIGAYLLSWGPFLVWTCLQAFKVVSFEDPFDTESEDVHWEESLENERKFIRLLVIEDVMYLVTFTSSVVNPLIFGYYNSSFQQEVRSFRCSRICITNCKGKASEPPENETVRSQDDTANGTATTKL